MLTGQITDSDTSINLKETQISTEKFTFEWTYGRQGRALKGYAAAKRSIRESAEELISTKGEQLRVAEEFKVMQLLNRYQQAEVAAR
ncbi:hypothetical protein [Endozoicomonas numazuensis]|uniref:Uncharacterized protein n=1 Tax=Endozoicomonas numazuensis TaxID=1137799 RepID=A0A081NK69_9GAMM|nr:hypothetical protein [Endozoicomonas numazuensis]KEQ18842.1 hypothetical protein GZ78_01875 [Endozoicomonas numazuensis]